MVKIPTLARLLVGLVASLTTTEAAPRQLFLLLGQSNMAGRGPLDQSPQLADPRIKVFTAANTWAPAQDPLHFDKPELAGVGPGLMFARQLEAADPTMEIGLVPAAVGGSSLDDWAPGGKLYTAALERARAALTGGELAGVLWHQGESDSAPEKAATYATRFSVFVARLRTDLRTPDLPVVVGETGRFRPDGAEINAVLAALPNQIPHCAFVASDGLADKGDRLHFDTSSARDLGRRYAGEWLKLHRATLPPPPEPEWHDVTTWGVEGREFVNEQRERWFDRLPAEAKEKVGDIIWNLSRDSSGMVAHFRTDATVIHVRYDLTKDQLAEPHMSAVGRSGVDLYARDETGHWRWVAVSRPESPTVKAELIHGLAPGFREYALYLPLANGLSSLSIGVTVGARFEGLRPRTSPIVFYGTSINHGYSASRPGMTHIAILGRRLDWPVANLGFSGNGRMDLAAARLLGRIDAAVFVIDCLPNMNPVMVAEKTVPFVRLLRELRPETPIVLVEDRRIANEWIVPVRRNFHDDNHAALLAAFTSLTKAGVSNLYYIQGDNLLGDDNDGTVDSSHPNDLGFFRQANAMEPELRRVLGR